jgi:aspartokinase
MITITSALEELLQKTDSIPFGTPVDLLNVSALARILRPQVEKMLQKPVKHGTLVVCLNRVLERSERGGNLPPKVELENFSIQSGLVAITYPKTPDTLRALERIYQDAEFSQASFFAFTHGIGEVTIVAQKKLAPKIYAAFGDKQPKFTMEHVGSLSVQFSEKYIKVPNVIFAILQSLASKQLNIVEIASTLTELTVILDEDDLDVALQVLRTGLPAMTF